MPATFNSNSADRLRGGSLRSHLPGRSRFKIPGLYRNVRLKGRLEQQLIEQDGIHQVSANVRTATLLVVYAKDLTLATLQSQIEALLGSRLDTRTQELNARPTRGLDLARLRDAFAALLGEFSAIYSRVPVGILNGAGAAAQAESQSAEVEEIFPWHQLPLEEVLERLQVRTDRGLHGEEALQRLQRYGANSLAAGQRRPDLFIFMEQFLSAPVAMLGVSAVVSILTGGAVDAAVILGVVLINAVIGFVTERQAEMTISSLAKTGVSQVTLLRDG